MSEWLKVAVSKTVAQANLVPRVQIPLSPPKNKNLLTNLLYPIIVLTISKKGG